MAYKLSLNPERRGYDYDLSAVAGGCGHRVAALFVRRLLLMKEEFIRISPDDQRVLESEEIVREKLSRIDFWGKTLTGMLAGLLVLLGLTVLVRGALNAGLLR